MTGPIGQGGIIATAAAIMVIRGRNHHLRRATITGDRDVRDTM
jgi:hypothetical protein